MADDLDLIFDQAHAVTPIDGGMDLDAIFDQAHASAESPGFWQSTYEGAKNMPADTLQGIKSIPSGVSNIYNSIFSPIKSIEDGTTERALRGTGKLASGVAGAGAGATLGAFGGPAAPITVPVGAALGAAASLLGFDWLNQATGSDAPTTPEQDLQSLGYNTGSGLAGSAALKTAKASMGAIKKAAPKITETANALGRRSLGTRQSDYGKASDVRTIETPEGSVETPVKAALDDLVVNEKLGASRDPATMIKIADATTKEINRQITEAIKHFDETSSIPAKPDFSGARAYLDSGSVPADLVESYATRLDDLEQGINSRGGGDLSYLQKQKVALGKSYDPADAVKSGFDRAIYDDLKTSIESYYPEIKGLNAELSKYMTVDPILTRSLKAAESQSPVSKLRDLFYTTGGIGAPTLAGTMLGGPVGTALGASVGLATKALASPTGQAKIAKGLRGAAKVAGKAETVGKAINAAETPLIGGIEATESSKEKPKSSAITDTFKTEKPMEDMKPKAEELAPVKDEILDAVRKVESSDGKFLVSKAGARGAYQFMPATAKAYNVDPTDQNEEDDREGAWNLIQDEFEALGSLPLALASYNAGRRRVNQAIQMAGSRDWPEVQAALRELGLDETADYVTKYQKLGIKV